MIIEKAILKPLKRWSKSRRITKTVVTVSNSSQRDHKRAQSFGRGAAKPLGLGKGRKGFEIPLQLHSQNSHAAEKKHKQKQASWSDRQTKRTMVVACCTTGNLRTTTKFTTTTTSVDWEKTGTRTSVSAGKRKLKMQSVGRSTTTTLNVNTNVKLWCSFATKFFAMASFKTMQDLIFKPYV